ncbi:ATP-binding cassette domain-containing protein [Streptomyces sp. NPDC018045]|uniref:ATP-binding cassette domain-containing protein n=1 Tax=Streptomyces sp. NPDC018045 TaxID=3365037 RepID=UPI00379AFE10
MTLELSDCTYRYRRRRPPVLNGLTYRLPDGLTVLLGANGAGKSTLLRLAASVTRPESGTVSLDGLRAGTTSYRRAVAWMPQSVTAMHGLTAREQVAYCGWLKGMSSKPAWEKAAQALDAVGLSDRAGTKTTELSGGQLRRLGVAGALVHDAHLLLLDEPTAGMDPRQRRVFRDLLNQVTRSGVRVLMSTHDVADLAEEADHVTVLVQGHIAHSGPTRTFLAHAPADTPPGRAAEAAYSALVEATGSSTSL